MQPADREMLVGFPKNADSARLWGRSLDVRPGQRGFVGGGNTGLAGADASLTVPLMTLSLAFNTGNIALSSKAAYWRKNEDRIHRSG